MSEGSLVRRGDSRPARAARGPTSFVWNVTYAWERVKGNGRIHDRRLQVCESLRARPRRGLPRGAAGPARVRVPRPVAGSRAAGGQACPDPNREDPDPPNREDTAGV